MAEDWNFTSTGWPASFDKPINALGYQFFIGNCLSPVDFTEPCQGFCPSCQNCIESDCPYNDGRALLAPVFQKT